MSIEVAGSAIGRKAGWLGPNLRGCKSDKGYQLRLIAWPQTAVKPFGPSGRPKERTCAIASRSGTLAAVTTTPSTKPKVSTTVWRFLPAGTWRLCQTRSSEEPSLQSQHFDYRQWPLKKEGDGHYRSRLNRADAEEFWPRSDLYANCPNKCTALACGGMSRHLQPCTTI